DILPGSGIKAVEEDSLRQMAHGREILSRLRTEVFLSMMQKRVAAEDGTIPLFVWNPHPYPVNAIIECEMQLADQNWNETFFDIEVFEGGKKVPSQIEHEASNLNLDWRKKLALNTKLPPGSIVRYECRPTAGMSRKMPSRNGQFLFDNGKMRVLINSRSGLIDSFKIAGTELVRPGTGRVLVMKDNADPWGVNARSYRKRLGSFTLMNRAEASEFAGFAGHKLSPVRVIEDGKVRTIVEALFKYKKSTLRLRYYLPKHGTQMELHLQVNNQQPDCMYKLSCPFIDKNSRCMAQDIFGRKEIPGTGEEKVFGQWFAAVSEKYNLALGIICDSGHGLDFYKGEMRYSLMRSPCYSALPIKDRPLISSDRAHDRIDIGQREFRFRICGGPANDLPGKMERIGTLFSEAPPALIFFPGNTGKDIEDRNIVELADGPVVMTCCRCLSDGQSVLRLFNSSKNKVVTKLSVLDGKINTEVELLPFEIKNFKIDLSGKTVNEIDGI
ncbi:MAG: glycoside hydrolase family 38 C-terminal domain-containing protein, partial [Victivallaceae bacterium]